MSEHTETLFEEYQNKLEINYKANQILYELEDQGYDSREIALIGGNIVLKAGIYRSFSLKRIINYTCHG